MTMTNDELRAVNKRWVDAIHTGDDTARRDAEQALKQGGFPAIAERLGAMSLSRARHWLDEAKI